jgi:hypothetical protein
MKFVTEVAKPDPADEYWIHHLRLMYKNGETLWESHLYQRKYFLRMVQGATKEENECRLLDWLEALDN